MRTPAWANHLNREVCESYGVPPVDHLSFRRSQRLHTTGRHWRRWRDGGSRISISAGTNGEAEHRAVFLHELAHHISASRRRNGRHDVRFWRVAWSLFRDYGVTTAYMEREFRYRATAARVALDMKIPGAAEAHARVRAENPPVHRERRREGVSPRFPVGAVVRFAGDISPEYAIGMRARVVRPLQSRYEVRVLETRGRFRKGCLVRISPEALIAA